MRQIIKIGAKIFRVQKPLTNFAFIDSQNLHLGIRDLGWKLDYQRFRVYLTEKYSVVKAFLFIGLIVENQNLYTALQSAGFILVFKPVLEYADSKIKGNCDAELVLHTMIEFKNYKKAVIVSADGDFFCLVKYLREKGKLETLLVPNQFKYSALLKRSASQQISFINSLRGKLEFKKKRTPNGQDR